MKEEEIRPQAIFDEYLKLAAKDTEAYFNDVETDTIACPACQGEGVPAFTKHGFTYELCPDCGTLFVSPRPVNAAFIRYYTEAPSVEYWATTFYKVTADSRREKLWKPKARLILDELQQHQAEKHHVVDIGGGFGIFSEEMAKLIGSEVTIIEPGPKLADSCRERGLPVVQKFLEAVESDDLPNGSCVFVSFELFEHLHDPAEFLSQLYRLMKQGDRFIFTTLSGSGVDIQTLWQDSKSVSPPHHLNFLNPHSVKLLLARLGFDKIKVTTPGKLDVDILCNNRKHVKDRFLKTFIDYATDEQKEAWQKVIANTGWSSHMMVSGHKPK